MRIVYTDGFTTCSGFFSGGEISPFFDHSFPNSEHEIGKRIGIFLVFSSVNSTFFLSPNFRYEINGEKKHSILLINETVAQNTLTGNRDLEFAGV